MGSVNSKSSFESSRSFKIPAIELAENSTRHNATGNASTSKASPNAANQKNIENDTASINKFLILQRFSAMECRESAKHLNHPKEDEIGFIQKDRNNLRVEVLRRAPPITSSEWYVESLQTLKRPY